MYIGYIIVYYTYVFVYMAREIGRRRREASETRRGRREESNIKRGRIEESERGKRVEER